MSEKETVLKVHNLKKYFGGLRAVNGVDMEIKNEEIVGLIGPNGCGKSTTFNTITGILPATAGSVKFFGEESIDKEPHEINKLGVSRTFQQTRLWRDLTVIENLLLPPKNQSGTNIFNLFFKPFKVRREEEALIEEAFKILEILEIEHVANNFASDLSGGQSKLVDVGRVLMSKPKIMLMDEPVAGVAPPLAEKIFHKIVQLRDDLGITILMIEHDMDFILKKEVDNIFVMSSGKIIAEGKPEEIQDMKHVQEAYLGY